MNRNNRKPWKRPRVRPMQPTIEEANLPLGSCCGCGKEDGNIKDILMLPYEAPQPGTGWGCIPCRLSNNGAIAVLCEACLEKGLEAVEFVCDGFPEANKRVPIDAVKDKPFIHDGENHQRIVNAAEAAYADSRAKHPMRDLDPAIHFSAEMLRRYSDLETQRKGLGERMRFDLLELYNQLSETFWSTLDQEATKAQFINVIAAEVPGGKVIVYAVAVERLDAESNMPRYIGFMSKAEALREPGLQEGVLPMLARIDQLNNKGGADYVQ